ncbi:hypothetical protein LSAT2_005110 [Lamellibrachia satsuma]|nr:hypothetical protein LSAT2_005110 [Lamellibrachia satsuma]
MELLLIAGFVWRMKKRHEEETMRCETSDTDPDNATSPCLPSSPGRSSSSGRSSSLSDMTSSGDTDDDEGDDGDVEAGRPNISSPGTTMAGRLKESVGPPLTSTRKQDVWRRRHQNDFL